MNGTCSRNVDCSSASTLITSCTLLMISSAALTASGSGSVAAVHAAGPGVLRCDTDPTLRTLPFCDATLPIPERVDDLLGRLDVDAKIGQLGLSGAPVPHLAVDAYVYGGEALHGVWSSCVVDDNTTASSATTSAKPQPQPQPTQTGRIVCPTQFAMPIVLGSSFDRALWQSVASATSLEARALYLHNQRIIASASSSPPARGLEGPLGLTYYAPNVNLIRDPRWGRAGEVPSEDPVLNGLYGAAFVRGFQDGDAPHHDADDGTEQGPYPPSDSSRGSRRYIRAAAVVKHYAAYSLEQVDPPGGQSGRTGTGSSPDRHSFDAVVTAQDMTDTYTPAFEMAVDAGAAGVMCSYNAINGIPACTDASELKGRLRTRFGFDGVVATDCGALADAHLRHSAFDTGEQTVAAALGAGVDSNCGTYYPTYVRPALGNGTVRQSEIDSAVRRLFTMRMRLGLFEAPDDPDVPQAELAEVDSFEHRKLALRSAREGIVLLQNRRGRSRGGSSRSGDEAAGPRPRPPLLPLLRAGEEANRKKIALVGPNANATLNLLGSYHGSPPFAPPSLLSALRSLWPGGGGGGDAVAYSMGCSIHGGGDGSDEDAAMEEAVRTAASADVAVAVLGLCGNNYANEDPSGVCPHPTEAEGTDRASLFLPGRQSELLRRVVGTGTRTVLVLISAGAVDIGWAKGNVDSILWSGYGGQEGGVALAEALLGTINPGGALPYTWVSQRFVDVTEYADMGMRPSSSSSSFDSKNRTTTTRNNPGRTYRFLDTSVVEPLWPFGFGLSYSTFRVEFEQVPRGPIAPGETTAWFVNVRNVGGGGGGTSPTAAGDVVVACYVSSPPNSVPGAPIRSLFDFDRVRDLSPGEGRLVNFELAPRGRAVATPEGRWSYPHGEYVVECEAGGITSTGKRRLLVSGMGMGASEKPSR